MYIVKGENYLGKTRPIPLGQRGEHNARCIHYDISDLISEFGEGEVVWVLQRNGDPVPYIAESSTVDGTTAILTLTYVETSVSGNGKMELRYYAGEVLCKTLVWVTEVLPSLYQTDEVPNPYTDLVDRIIRELIDIRKSLTGAVHYIGETTSEIVDGASTSPITINGKSVEPASGDVAIYDNMEFIWNGEIWNEFGSTGSLKALAFKDSAEATYTPAGTISTPTITITPSVTTVTSIDSVGSLPSFDATLSGETLSLSWSSGSLPTKKASETVVSGIASAVSSKPSFTGTQATITSS